MADLVNGRLNLSKGKRMYALLMISIASRIVFFACIGVRNLYYNQLIAALGLTNAEYGMLGSVNGIANLIFYLPSGFIADKVNTKTLLVISFLGLGGLTIWFVFFPSYICLLIIFFGYGIFSIFTFWSAMLKYVRLLGSEEEQGKMFGLSEGIKWGANALVGFAGLAIIGAFVDGVAGIRVLLFFIAGLYIAFALLILFTFPGANTATDEPVNLRRFVEVLKVPGTWLTTLIVASAYMAFAAAVAYFGPYCADIIGVSDAVASGLAITRNYVIAAVATIIGGLVADKFASRAKVLAVYFVLGIAATISIMITPTTLAFGIVTTCLATAFFCATRGISYAVMGEAGIPVSMTGVAMGIISVFAYAPESFMYTMMGSWLDADKVSGYNSIFIWIIVWSVIGLIVSLVTAKLKLGEKNNVIGSKDGMLDPKTLESIE